MGTLIFTVKEKHLLKEGETNGRQWQLAKIVTSDERELMTLAHKNYKEGETYEREIEEKKKEFKGKTYTSYNIIEPKEQKPAQRLGGTKASNGEEIALLKEISGKLSELIEIVGLR